MEDLKRRWSVTYTKHIKQKRKVYHDGFLDLHVSTNKVKLLDDCEKLLECRILKDEEVASVRCGETLSFEGYLVDVGDPEGDRKPITVISKQNTSIHRKKFRSPTIPSGDRKDEVKRNNNLSPSRKFIREFKKSQMQKYGASPRNSDLLGPSVQGFETSDAYKFKEAHGCCAESANATKSNITEWQAMYTKQVTQKAKKYHDGFLRLANDGSFGRQIKLYDASRKLLDSRFLKKDEIIRSGESIEFDAHLVDIGEPEEQNQLVGDLNVQGDKVNVFGEAKTILGHQDCLKTNKSLPEVAGNLLKHCFLGKVTDSNSISSIERMKLSKAFPGDKPLRDARQILSILQKPISQDTVVGSVDKKMTVLDYLGKGLQISDMLVDSPDSQLPGAPLPDNGPSENLVIEESAKLMDLQKSADLNSSKAKLNSSGSQLFNENEGGNIEQVSAMAHGDNMEAETKRCDDTSDSGISDLASGCASQSPYDKGKDVGKLKSENEMAFCPTFDLGF